MRPGSIMLARFDRLARILDEIGDRLGDQAAVEGEIDRGRRARCTSMSSSPALTRCRIVASLTTAARSCVSRVALGMRAKAENSSTMRPISPTCRMIVSVHCSKTCLSVWISRAVFALETLGRKLDRRQRILDLMRDAPGDVGPGRVALRRDELGDVVEGHDMAMLGLFGGLGRHPHDETAVLACRPAC